MKKLFSLLLLSACTLGLCGCLSEETYPEEFVVADFDLSGVKSIRIDSGFTGNGILVTDADAIAAVVEAVMPLEGCDPVSTRGYYGWSYGMDFYETDSPTDEDAPVLAFSIFDCSHDTTYLISDSVYEVQGGHAYPAMYLTDAAAADIAEIVCAELMGESDL